MFNASQFSEVSKTTAMKPGFQVMAKLKEFALDDKGQIVFQFENETGVLKHTEYNNFDEQDPTTEDGRKRQTQCAEKTLHIFGAFIPKATLDKINANTYKEFVKFATDVLTKANVIGTECVLHVVVNGKGFISFPQFPNFISTKSRPCSWVTNPQYHSYEQVTIKKADVEATHVNPFASQPESDTILPF
jgi:hypothetical protein